MLMRRVRIELGDVGKWEVECGRWEVSRVLCCDGGPLIGRLVG